MKPEIIHYTVVRGGKTDKAIDEYCRIHDEAHLAACELAKKYGAHSYTHQVHVRELVIDGDAPIGFRKTSGGNYTPDRKTKIGKSISKEFSQIRFPDIWDFQRLCGINEILTLPHIKFASFETLAGTRVLSVPMGEKQQWKPEEGDVVELKQSEFLALQAEDAKKKEAESLEEKNAVRQIGS